MSGELFPEDGADMIQEAEGRLVDAADEIRDALAGRHVCPFCGMINDQADGPCPRCTMENTAGTRQATKARVGPWYVLQNRNPAAPGMRFETMLAFVRKQKVKPRSIVRGPTTHQLWRFAAHVRGISREFGVCYSCGGEIERTANLCPHCNRLQEPPANPDAFLESQDYEAGAVYREVSEPPLVVQDVAAPRRGSRGQPPASTRAPDPEPNRGKRPSDGFLSAQDLAAAFKLNFTPKPGTEKQPLPNVAPRNKSRGRRRRHWKRWVLLLLLAAAGGAFAFQYHRDSNFRVQTRHWYDQGMTWGRQSVAWVQEHARKLAQSAQSPAKPQPAIVPTPNPAPSAAPSATEPSPWDRILNGNPGADQAIDQTPKQQSPQRAPTEQTSSAPAPPPTLDDARALYRAALDAEDKGDYATAVKKYEQIEKFPQDLRPRDLDLRLREARDRLH